MPLLKCIEEEALKKAQALDDARVIGQANGATSWCGHRNKRCDLL